MPRPLDAVSLVFASFLLFAQGSLPAQTSSPANPAKHVTSHKRAVASPRAHPEDDNYAAPPDFGKPDPAITAALKDISAGRIRATIDKLVSFGTRLTISANDPQLLAKGRGVVAASRWIQSEFERYSQACGGCLEVKTDSFTQAPGSRVPQPTPIVNVYAVLPGADPEASKRIYLVTGHYDSRPSDDQDLQADAPGANDDASGTAVSLECARVLSQHKFPATIIFLTVAGEEQGLYGSEHFAKMAAKMAKDAGWDLEAVLNNDIVGGDKSTGQDPSIVRVFSAGIPENATPQQIRLIAATGGENDSPSRELARYIRGVGRLYSTGHFGPKLVFRPDRYLRGGDHLSFNEAGFAAVRFTEYRENFARQHQNVRAEQGIQYGDLPRFVDFEYVANVARLNAATLAALASAPAPPRNVRLAAKQLENDSTLTWDPSPGNVAGYEVLWRTTTQSEWDNVQSVGNVTQATLQRSKDNVIFAVRALDRQGHRSLAVVPAPER